MLDHPAKIIKRISVREHVPATSHPAPHQYFLAHIEQDRLIRQAVNNAIKPLGMSGLQWLVLAVIADAAKHGTTMSDISQKLSITQPQVTALTQGLLASKYAKQKINRNDQRSRYLIITLSGRRVLSKAQQHVGETIQKIIDEELVRAAVKVPDTPEV